MNTVKMFFWEALKLCKNVGLFGRPFMESEFTKLHMLLGRSCNVILQPSFVKNTDSSAWKWVTHRAALL